ncbi:hypothetical protein CONPUDRAFT_162044 [Coniophora puteana RWD-64-598 SS2]|uniref:FAD-binding domain-containing protein n=1 Tax=Coniophora puteana (strain RWD-64-598) TaxID=741705 RepID=A0A5M3N073_CONPW|nr:uncharacterized protein CONPUDRAFT_162044 [Coniophora puteana RWD-64-598 SS2]EIW84676.1 hypothetical protein CONPUDRAFT_162044 [Coniophora puteana RWD-64-598 SS2]
MPSSTQVLIAGAGPVGLVAALTLVQSGVSVRIIEKEHGPRPGERGAGTYPRTLEVYHFLGVNEIRERGEAVSHIQSHIFGSIDVVKEFPFLVGEADPTPAIPINRSVALGQTYVEQILASHLEKLGCAVEYGKELLTFEQNEEGVVVHISSQNGSIEADETVEAQLMIGADGARGVVRKQLGLTFLGETREDTRIITADIRIKCAGLSRDHWHHFGDADGASLFFRPSNQFGDNDGWQLILSGDRFDIERLAADKEAVYSCVKEAVGAPIQFMELIWISQFRPNIRMVDTFGKRRVLVAGDAAQLGGQGMNSGVQDAFNLAWKVALVAKGMAPLSLLESYTAERLPVIAQMLNLTTTLLDKTFGARREKVDQAYRRDRILFMLGVNYRTSPIVLDEFSADIPAVPAYNTERTDELVAGDRAPDAPALVEGDNTVSLFNDVFKPTHHTALVFAADIQAANPVLKSLAQYSGISSAVIIIPATAKPVGNIGSARIVIDKEGHAHTNYLVKGGSRVVIVRPDGVVGAIVAGQSGVEKYFGLIQGRK